jgi:ribosomal protein S18 acetylase RimI-like enzyme
MAARLMLKLIRHAMLRGETSFLHVLSDNLSAQRLYRAMGFRDHCEVAGHVIMRDSLMQSILRYPRYSYGTFHAAPILSH